MKNLDDKIRRQRQAKNRNDWFLNQFKAAQTDKLRYYALTENEMNEIKDFWAPYDFAVQNDMRNQWVFSRASGVFDPSYIGFGTQLYILNSFWNHFSYTYIRNKNNMPYVFYGIKTPETIVCNNYGFYQDCERNLLSFDEASTLIMQALKEEKELVIKPSAEGEGYGVGFICSEITENDVKALFLQYKKDFIVQKIIKNHESISVFKSDCLNTFRMSSLSWRGKLYYNGAVLRIGVQGRVDNASRGGVFIRVYDDGALADYAMDEFGNRYYEHPVSKIPFKGHRICGFEKVISLCKKVHGQVPQQRVLSLDAVLDENGDAVLVETNSPGGTQLLQLYGINPYHNRSIASEIFDIYLRDNYYILNEADKYIYREYGDHIDIVKYVGCGMIEEIPVQIDGKQVRTILDNAFADSSIRAIKINKDIVFNKQAFAGKNKSIIIEQY